ncbi:MAG: dihydroorotase [Methylophilaceae bacterium]|jgi:dihydroorotase
MINKITISRPDDWHLHLRDGAALQAVVADTAKQFGRAIVMPNLQPPVTNVALAGEYRERILQALPADSTFQPLMTLYLTDKTTVDVIHAAKASGFVHGVKLYPAGATTNSDSGVTSLEKCAGALQTMQDVGLPLLVHAEVTDPDVDVFDREKVFINRHMKSLIVNYPDLKVVFEHITTKDAAEFVTAAGPNVAATITVHHLLMNRNDLFKGGIRPHNYCLPILKREEHRLALVKAATSGSPKFFLGTDSAPHAKNAKESSCGCAGMYTAHAAVELYAEVFEAEKALDKLEGFASFYGADFYGLPRSAEQVTLSKESWLVPDSYPYDGDVLVPLRAGETIAWKIV